jgi:hypothetical protein
MANMQLARDGKSHRCPTVDGEELNNRHDAYAETSRSGSMQPQVNVVASHATWPKHKSLVTSDDSKRHRLPHTPANSIDSTASHVRISGGRESRSATARVDMHGR